MTTGYLAENQRFVRFCVTAILLFSVFFFASPGVRAATDNALAADAAVSYGGELGKVMVPLVESNLAAIDTFTVVLLMSFISLARPLLISALSGLGVTVPEILTDYSFGIFDNRIVCVILLIWFGLPRVLEFFNVTNPFAKVMEVEEDQINTVIMIAIIASQILANFVPELTAYAVSAEGVKGALTQGFSLVGCILLLSVSIVMYFFIRHLGFLFDISILPVSMTIPFVSFGVAALRTVFAIAMIFVARYLPVVFAVFFGLLFLLGVILFKRSYRAIRYFKSIYAKPLLKKLFGMRGGMPLVAPRLPHAVRAYAEEKHAEIVIPAFLLKKMAGVKGGSKYERWWIVSAPEGTVLCRAGGPDSGCTTIPLASENGKKLFINQAVRFHEVFTLAGPESEIVRKFLGVKKQTHIVFSKEYLDHYDRIRTQTGWIDYANYSNYLRTPQAAEGMNG